MTLVLVLLTFLSIDHAVSKTVIPEDEWCWTWVCLQGNCVRNSGLLKPDSNIHIYTSLGECRLVCNEFSTTWPRPSGKFQVSRKTVTVHPESFSFDYSSISGDLKAQEFIKNATDTLLESLKFECPTARSCSRPVLVTIITLESDLTLDWNTDESYSLTVNGTDGRTVEILIKANTVYGARHALESLGQMTACHLDINDSLVIMDKIVLTDKPTYSHRGLMLDSSRHFLSEETIIRTIRAMAMSKMNVFHWHLTDSQSFPFYSQSVPEFTKYGAFSAKEVYSPGVIKRIVEFARSRGIRVIPEFDGPAHAGNGWQWGPAAGLGNLAVCINAQPWTKYCIQPPCGQLNPVNPALYHVLKKLYRDIQELFPADMFHMGGDEVYFPCWLSDPTIVSWMKSNRFNITEEGFLMLWKKYQDNALAAWDEVIGNDNTPIILWSSRFTDPSCIEKFLDNDRYVIETWVDQADETPLQLLAKGYGLIIASLDAWYLDHGFWGNTRYHKWNTIYNNRLPEAKLGVYGGEVCMWGELVGEAALDNRIWPRASCMAERLWTDPDERAEKALPRLETHITRLSTRGIHPEAIQDEWCSQNDGLCHNGH